MRLYFLRHAQAEERGRVDDFARELTSRGEARTANGRPRDTKARPGAGCHL